MNSINTQNQGLARAGSAFQRGHVAQGLQQICDTVALTRESGREVAPTTWKSIASLVNRSASAAVRPKGGGSPRPKGGGHPAPKGGGHPRPKGGGHPRPK